MAAHDDLVIRNGRWFDGTGSPGLVRDLVIRDGLVAHVSATPVPVGDATRVIDAEGCWVLPGLIDVHTHYDAEVLVNPGLGESVRHGVTTVVMGSCSLSAVLCGPEDVADLFSRVEAVPYAHVRRAMEDHQTWSSPAGFVEALERLPIGPNVACFLGHSDLRAHVMGLARSVHPHVRPTRAEQVQMEHFLEVALDAGLLGLSTMTTELDKVGGSRATRSRPLPSTHARWREYRRLNDVLRRRTRVLQSAPDARRPWNAVLFLAQSRGRTRPRLRTSLLVAADGKAVKGGASIGRAIGWCNRVLGTDVRMQHLPVPFELYSDGIDLPVFEELGAGSAALHLQDALARTELLRDESYRRRFREELRPSVRPSLWSKDLADTEIVACPDASVVGRSFADVARARGIHVGDAFLDLLVEHGDGNVRWRTTVANHRPDRLDRMADQEGIQIGFSDAGAHLRNMAFYNTGLRLLRRVRDADRAGRPFLTVERAVHRLTGELGEWFHLDAGFLRVGDRADLVIVDPERLDHQIEAYAEAPVPEFGGLSRMVRRNDDTVVATVIGGQVVYGRGRFADGYGTTRRTGRFLRAGERQRDPIPSPVPVGHLTTPR